MGADSCISDRLKEIRLSLEYTQTRMGEAVGGKLRSWQEYESGTRMPGGSVFAGLARLGVNVNWVLTGEGPQMRTAPAPANASDAPISAEVLEDVLKVLRRYQDKRGRHWLPEHEARLAVEIYQYLMEMEQQPTPADRARTLELVTTILGGLNVEATGAND